MNVYHYSNVNGLSLIDPSYHGTHGWTPKYSPDVSYFYTEKREREKFFKSASYCYTVNVDRNKIYNTFYDDLGIFSNNTLFEMIAILKQKGYDGLLFVQQSGVHVVCLFYPALVRSKEIL
jgi:hypothetical protein